MKMPIKEPDNFNWAVVIALLVITFLGSVASYTYKIINGHKFSVLGFIAQAIISMFSGLIMFFIASYFHLEFELAGGLCGLAGWSGAAFVSAIEKRLLKKARGE